MSPLILWVAVGSAIGGSARYLMSRLVSAPAEGIPWATFAVNVTGSFMVGLIVRHATVHQIMTPQLRAFLVIGFCGGYTTFSAFSLETMTLIERGRYGLAFTYVMLSVTVCLTATFAGLTLGGALPDNSVSGKYW